MDRKAVSEMAGHSIFISGHSAEWCRNLVVAFKQNGYDKTFTEDQGDLMQHVKQTYPDIVLRKFENHQEALGLIKDLKEISPYSMAIVIVDNPDHFDLPELIAAGMRGCLPIRLRPYQIVAAVDLIGSAGIICIPRLSPRVLEQSENRSAEDITTLLTSRELEILKLLGKDLSNQDMADELYLSVSTVKTHLRNIYRKLNLGSRREVQELLKEMGFNDKNDAVRPISIRKYVRGKHADQSLPV
jgi:NarL family two-component system response regulator LiaR